MDLIIKFFDMFRAAAIMLAGYIPQNKEDILDLLARGWALLGGINVWLGNVFGVDIQKIIDVVAEFCIKYFSLAFNFLIELVKKLAERV